ncbi:Ig-like domain-containing protein [Clostridium sp.]|uniref:Ig-like domain-containing protein n=1 Tax=Clostridium sp. TaxID=1506 RepID=UPI0039F5B2DC
MYQISDDVIESFYHTTSKNTVEAVEIDGNEVTLYFGDDYQLPETAYVFVDADVLEDLWEKENDDLNIKVNVVKDNQRPEIKKIEQDEDSNYKIIITFNEDIEKKSSEDKGNYTVKDKDGKELRISKAEKTDDDEVTLTLSKELEDGDKYEVTVEDVEDKAGNKISKVTKTFTAKETQAVKADDITVRYYDAGKSNQKIVVDFDTKMLADGSRYAINNLENYDLTIVKGWKDL